MKKPRDDLTSVLARLQQLEATVAALKEIIAPQLHSVPPARAAKTITPKEAAYELGVTEGRISQLIKAGELRATRVGGRYHIDVASVQRRCSR